MANHQRIMYLRNNSRQIVGCVAWEQVEQTINFSLAACAPQDSFNRSLARKIALGRLNKHPWKIQYSANKNLSLHDIMKAIWTNIAESEEWEVPVRNDKPDNSPRYFRHQPLPEGQAPKFRLSKQVREAAWRALKMENWRHEEKKKANQEVLGC